MNYSTISDRTFATTKSVSLKKKRSAEADARKAYFASHQFSVSVNPTTKEGVLKVTQNER